VASETGEKDDWGAEFIKGDAVVPGVWLTRSRNHLRWFRPSEEKAKRVKVHACALRKFPLPYEDGARDENVDDFSDDSDDDAPLLSLGLGLGQTGRTLVFSQETHEAACEAVCARD
jgi:hypothetical protein